MFLLNLDVTISVKIGFLLEYWEMSFICHIRNNASYSSNLCALSYISFSQTSAVRARLLEFQGAWNKFERTKMRGNPAPANRNPTARHSFISKSQSRLKLWIIPENLRNSGCFVELDARHRPLRNCAIFGSSVKWAKFRCIQSFLAMCEYWNFLSFIRIIENQTWSSWSVRIFRTFPKCAGDCCVCKAGFTPRTQALRGTHFTELRTQLLAAILVASRTQIHFRLSASSCRMWRSVFYTGTQ